MIPSALLIGWVAVLAVAGVIGLAGDLGVRTWVLVACALIAIVVVDAFRAFRLPVPRATRRLARAMALQTRSFVRLEFMHELGRPSLRVKIFDHFPEVFECDAFPMSLDIVPGEDALIVRYECTPQLRGSWRFDGLGMRIASPLGLWWRQVTLPVNDEVRVYPNFSTVTRSVLRAQSSPLQQNGVHLRRQRGEGLEFHELRDYREGDSLRALDWKATSRMGRMISRDYRDERDQNLIFIVDAGRRMRAKDGALSHFDHTLNALLVLAYVALRQGDSVGVMTVGRERAWFPPRKGAATINDILGHVFSLEPVSEEVDYVAAATELAVRQRRRSLVVMLTNVRDEDTEDLLRATRSLKQRHLVMLASLRERALDEVANEPVEDLQSALTFSATDRFLARRRKAEALMHANGVMVEDCLCDELAQAITNRYLAIKRAGML
ncbi:MAG: DUF58 domain-containing protein [Pseudomonadota bacterium]